MIIISLELLIEIENDKFMNYDLLLKKYILFVNANII